MGYVLKNHMRAVKTIRNIFENTMRTQIEFLKGDITKVKVDVIVNAANSSLLGGGGVDGAIHRAAGLQLLEECKTLGGCETGQAKITNGYRLSSKFVIHTVGPVWRGGKNNEEIILESCYRNSLELVKKKNLKSIAFPAISTGAYGFPINLAAPIALNAVKFFINDNPHLLEKVIFALFTEEDFKIYSELGKKIFKDFS